MNFEQYLENSYIVKHYSSEQRENTFIIEINLQVLKTTDDSSELLKLIRNVRSKIDKIYTVKFEIDYTL